MAILFHLFQVGDEAEDFGNQPDGSWEVVRLITQRSSDQNTDFNVTSLVSDFFQPGSTSPSSYCNLKNIGYGHFPVFFLFCCA